MTLTVNSLSIGEIKLEKLPTGLRRGELTALPEILLVWVKSGSGDNCKK